ncbi:S9 family peptidase [Sphingomonas sp. R1]|uniref:S9 family peptidase n=1 Tax=Sphingomonas sp. R1 TaxID=399176 RepID=UPI002224E6F6|nr:DPP IV N-terminal domain-containing protein [Sphingomonas sp. R1]UYY79419.1 DPP IV N-terminal domain-containing protein [Sphingomonas sp. R1]
MARLLAKGLAVTLLPVPVAVAQTPAPTIETRYALADRYLGDGLSKLVVDRSLRTVFATDSTGIVYRHGREGERVVAWYDLASGRSRPIAAEAAIADALAKALGRPLKPAALPIEDPRIEGGALQFSAFDKRWTWTADGTLAPAAKGAPDGDDALSPDGRFRIVARDSNLHAVETATGRETPLTEDGNRDQPYGRGIPQLADILAQGSEDPKMPVSVRWSPDSKRIVTWRLDTRDVIRLGIVQATPPGTIYPRTFRYIYPLAGAEKLPQATRLVIDVEQALQRRKARPVPLAIPSESLLYPNDPDMSWVNGKVRAQWTARGYTQLAVYQADPETGAATVVAREAMTPNVSVVSSFFQPAPELGGELLVSERSGWAQLYLVRPDAPEGGIPLTRGEWEVIGIHHVDAASGAILVTGVGREKDRNPYYTALYRVSTRGEPPVLLTPEPLHHEVQVAPDGKSFVDAMSTPSQPTRTVVRSAVDGRILVELGRADPSALLASGYRMPEPFEGVAADGTTPIWGMIYRPVGFDPARRYPVIDNVYTGPTTTQVPVSWGAAVFAPGSSVAQLGAIVVSIDGRGTSRRGRAFRMHAYRNLGEVGLDDHIALIRQMATRYPQFDLSRVGVFGGSAGGYDTARFVIRRPGFFKVGVASSGNHDLRLDKAWWPEVTMGAASPNDWARNSNMVAAPNLGAKLLLIHGDIDDNVPVTESFQLATALIWAGRDVDMVVLPNTTHAVYQPFFWRKFRDYFVQHLLGEAPPADIRFDTPAWREELPLLRPEK